MPLVPKVLISEIIEKENGTNTSAQIKLNYTGSLNFQMTADADTPVVYPTVKITVNHTKVLAAVDFVAFDLSLITDATFWSDVKSDGGDIRMYKADNATQIPFQVANINTTAKTGTIWFKSNDLSTSVDTDYYIHFGDISLDLLAHDDTYGSDNVWGGICEGVWHFDENTGTVAYDSSGNGRDGNFSGTKSWVAGQLGTAHEFDGTGDYFACGANPITGSAAFTMMFIAKYPTFKDYSGVITIGNCSVNYKGAYLGQSVNGIGGGFANVNKFAEAISAGWKHVVMTHAGGTNGALKIWVNNTLRVNTTTGAGITPIVTNDTIYLGRLGGYTQYDFPGTSDEIFLINKALSANEQTTFYNALMSNSTFFSVGSVNPETAPTWDTISLTSGTIISHTFTVPGDEVRDRKSVV